ncbi:MAG: RimK family alpha-L-glutamate ligase [Phycisphaerales bacterium]|nr:RimK family alpha-L-glutamate ligase [Phycisphaerales bacterium]MCI0631655.1 RimK family alpha-L-glutamate ligase [Phycisphaerales bacterium]MCI0676393.1 RimK family alpha-L-glutamate ligase [Phycisphaerales bacterium]
MKLAILSQAPRCYSTRRLKEAALGRGHDVGVLDSTRFSLLLEHGNPNLLYRAQPLEPYDAVIPRIRASITFFGTAVVRQFEQMGIYCLNSAEAIVDSRDKLRSMQLLSRHDVGIPPTAFVRYPKYFLPAIDSVGGAPVVLKLLQGAQGMGVILADSTKNAQAILETMRTARQNVLIQKFVAESKGRDVRALVVGDRVVAAVRRTAQGQEFRSNLHRGAKAEPVTLDRDYEATALRAAHIIGLDVAGVDMLEGKDGPQVTEVNSSPGLQGLELATCVDVAGAIVEFLEAQLTAHRDETNNGFTRDDYQLSEVSVSRDSELVGQTVHGSGLQGRGLVVLKLRRDDREIVRPDETVVIMPGDLLLCFGRSAELQALASDATGNGFH